MFKLKKINKKKKELKHPKIFLNKDVSRIYFRKNPQGKRIKLGGGLIGDIYEGTVIFKDKNGKSIRKKVAIKQFKDPLFMKRNKEKYKQIINDLRGIRLEFDSKFPNRDLSKSRLLPKMDFVKIKTERSPKGEFLLVTQAFSKGGKSKFYKNNKFNMNVGNKELINLLKEAAFINMKIIEKGYYTRDIITQFKKTKSLVPLDLDFAVIRDRITNNELKAKIMFSNINSMASYFSYLMDPNASLKLAYKFNEKIYKLSLEIIKSEEVKKYLIEEKKIFDKLHSSNLKIK